MTPERFQRIEELFFQALGASPGERDALLGRECAGDPELRRDVEEMLAAEQGTGIGHYIEHAAWAVAESWDTGRPERLGSYRIVSEIGHGGMGTVYAAERDDGQFEQRVAIKVVRQSFDGPFARERFLRERQMLARLNHPGIARLLDGGTTESGQPYFAMEFVDGQPLLEFSRERGLTLRERLELFRRICEAVEFAHQNLVVHRDIKPGNILVTREGQPKLLDFGIAKLAVEPDGAVPPATALLLTPDYASPEQICGEPITTATDIYSLGCVLYELLSGHRAHEFGTRSPAGIERVIREQDPEPLTRLARVDADLDNVVRKALAKDPRQRYASVEQFSRDLLFYLEGRPVAARAPSWTYRAGKFVRRNRVAMLAASVAIAAVVSGAGIAVWQARRANAQRDIAEQRFREGRKLANTVIFSVDEKLRNVSGTMEARRLIFENSVRYLDGLAGGARGDAGLQLELARAYERIGQMQGTGISNLGDSNAARISFERAIALLDRLDASGPGVRLARAGVHHEYAMVLQRLQDPVRARESLERCLALAVPLFAAEPDNPEAYRILMRAHSSSATARSREGDTRAALESARQALELAKSWTAKHPGDSLDLLASAHQRVAAYAQSGPGDLELARAAGLEAIRLRETIDRAGRNAGTRTLLAQAHTVFGDLLGNPLEVNLGEPAEALRHYRAALEIRREQSAADPANAAAAEDLAYALFNAALMERDTDNAGALVAIGNAARIAEQRLRAAPDSPNARRLLTLMKMCEAAVLASGRRYSAALSSYPEMIGSHERMLASEPGRLFLVHELMNMLGERGDLLLALHRPGAAIADYLRAARLGDAAAKRQPGNLRTRAMLAAARERLARAYRQTGDTRQACEWASRHAAVWSEWTHDSKSSVFSERGARRAAAALAGCR